MSTAISIKALDAKMFAPFGDVIELTDTPTVMINRGNCARFHDLATLSFTEGGEAGISLFEAKPYHLPHRLDLMERHPLGSQAFLPMQAHPFLVIVAPDNNGAPGTPLAFATNGKQGVNYHRNTWHGVLTPVSAPALFAVVDRVSGDGNNLEEFTIKEPWLIEDSDSLFGGNV